MGGGTQVGGDTALHEATTAESMESRRVRQGRGARLDANERTTTHLHHHPGLFLGSCWMEAGSLQCTLPPLPSAEAPAEIRYGDGYRN